MTARNINYRKVLRTGPLRISGKAAWSPDGNYVAFEHLGDGDMVPAQIYVMDATGRNVKPLTSRSGMQSAASDPAWSPDGSRIAFWNYFLGLATIELANQTVQRLYQGFPTVHYGASPAWSSTRRPSRAMPR